MLKAFVSAIAAHLGDKNEFRGRARSRSAFPRGGSQLISNITPNWMND